MKKYLLLILSILIISSTAALAESVAFGFGTNFFKPSSAGFAVSNGRIYLLDWVIDKDVTFGILNEETTLDYTAIAGDQNIGTLNITGIRMSKGIIKGVDVGIMLGSGTAMLPSGGGTSTDTSSIVDIFGSITLVEGTGDRITGALKANLAARYMDTTGLTGGLANDTIANLNGFNASLVVSVGF